MGTSVDNTLAYIDQASFLALRALGRGPVIQYVWIYERGVDLDGLRRFHRNLQHTLIGRVIERSLLPFGRHRWIAYGGPADLDIAVGERSRDQVWDWVDERSFVPVDPEFGPPWHLGVQPLIGGGAAVSLAVSHTTADAGAGIASIVDAAEGVRREFGFPSAAACSRRQSLRQDLALTARSARDIPVAVRAAVRAAREQQDDLSTSAAIARQVRTASVDEPVVVPRVYGSVDVSAWDQRAQALGATRNVLFAGFAARVGYRLDRVESDGRSLLSVPVSERTAGDTRANPLAAITVHADPLRVCDDLTDLRAATKQALVELSGTRRTLLAPLALTPLTPKSLVRRLEHLVLKVGKPIGCSNIGDIAGSANRPDGTDADFFAVRGGEAGVTAATLQRLGGHLLVSAASMRGRIWFSVASWESHRVNTRAALTDVVAAAAADFGLEVHVE
ncbi:diacylglycerol O-acyltransferase [Mycobacterium sp. MAA66]|uniref:hypothetical protein n=1 Tax=Mycobacterium sp. MAA66 TaxID=3156297 RepID=UPI0035140E8D